MKISTFFNTDYVDSASYDNLRKIASLVDGQKNAARKILYTILEKNIKDKVKVSQLGSKISEFSEYLHGNLDGVIVNLSQDYTGTNNIPLLQKNGNFGTRFTPDSSAARYIYAYGKPEFFELFNKSDTPILRHQYFEGNQIEPMFYVPALPILLINGSEGVSSGFAQKILPRNPAEIKRYIKNKLQGKVSRAKLIPHYNGFKGVIEQGETPQQWNIKGVVNKTGINKVEITEIPIGYDLKGYIKVLDTLEDKKIIQGYSDQSEDDIFKFIVQIPSKQLNEWDNDTLLNKLKLVKRVSENYTVMNEDNKIQIFINVTEILDKYISIKLEYVEKRKKNSIQVITEEIEYDISKYLFIKLIQDDKLIINKRKKSDIVKDLDTHEDICKKDNSYDYLLQMNIMSLTKERMEKLSADIKTKKENLDQLINSSIETLWMTEIDAL